MLKIHTLINMGQNIKMKKSWYFKEKINRIIITCRKQHELQSDIMNFKRLGKDSHKEVNKRKIYREDHLN